MSKLIAATKANPCIHCGRTKWCYSLGNLTVCTKDAEPATGWRKTSKKDGDDHYFYAPIDDTYGQTDKPEIIRTTYYDYPNRQGKPLARSVRHDLSDGSKDIHAEGWSGRQWVKTTKHIDRDSIPIYRYQEIREAIAAGKLIFWVEGESCVEALRALGLTATTNFGGSGRLKDSDLKDLDGANLVICPDRDVPGMKLASQVAEKFPAAKWLYAFPDSQTWNAIPQKGGADVKNWVEDYDLRAEDLIKAIEDRRDTDSSRLKLSRLGFSEADQQKLESIREAVDGLIAEKKSESEKLAFLTQLATVIRWDDSKLKSYYHLRLKELEEEDSRAETQSEIDHILDSLNDDISFDYLVHESLIPDLEALSDKLKLKRSSIYSCLLTAVSVLHKVGTTIALADDFEVSPNLFCLFVSPSGQGKSPLMNAIITKPFSKIEEEFIAEWEVDNETYLKESAEYGLMSKDEQRKYLAEKGVLKKPATFPKILFATDLNTIAVAKQFRQYPEQGFLGHYDEARKLFNFKGGGRSDDESNLCSLYEGYGIKELRASEDRTSVLATNFGIYGSIQPRILLDLMGEADDSQGQWARFIYTFQAKQQKVYELKYSAGGRSNLPTKLVELYRNILKTPKRKYQLTEEGQRALSIYLTNCTEAERMKQSDSVLETFLGKAGSRVAKLIVNIHILRGNEESKNELICESVVYNAIELDDYYTNQIKILYSKSRAMRGELAPKLVEILRIGGSDLCPVSARDVARSSWIFKKDKDSTDQIRSYFRQLEAMGYGVCQGTGNKTTFRPF